LELLGPVKASGLTPKELEFILQEQLRRTYMKDPHVGVFVRELESHPVSVVGAVKKPGVFQIRGTRTVIEMLSRHLEDLEDESLAEPTNETLSHIHLARRALAVFHRIEWAERETVLAMMRPETPFIMPETRTYLRDCFDHSVAVLELVETYRDTANGLMEVYLMQSSNRMNEVMKTLAIITGFFMPLSFLTGLYGMNFDRDVGNMPELGWRFGYSFFWCLVAVVVMGLFFWMRRMKWF